MIAPQKGVLTMFILLDISWIWNSFLIWSTSDSFDESAVSHVNSMHKYGSLQGPYVHTSSPYYQRYQMYICVALNLEVHFILEYFTKGEVRKVTQSELPASTSKTLNL
ncbi:hypothetical protein ACJX0J_032575 [Zea mays]